MRVSVIIPAYNEEAWIQGTLASLHQQDFEGEIEVIVVDNNSDDGTAEVARRWGAQVVHEKRQGYVYALDRGTREASGEILAFTDADTVLPKYWLSSFVRAFEEDSKVVAVGGTIDFYDANWKGNIYKRYILPFALFYDRLCSSHPPLWGATMAVRRDAFLKCGGWTGKFNLHADSDLSRRLGRIGKVKMITGLKVSTSARRYNQRLVVSTLVYGINFLGLQLLHRPIFFDFPAVRVGLLVGTRSQSAFLWKWLTPCAIGLLFTLLGSGIFFAASPTTTVFGRVFWHLCTRNKVIALTFDDGPNKPYTERILKILKENNIRATFFLIGENVKYYPELAREIVKEGHAIGNHSYSHPFFMVLERSEEQERQIDLAEKTIEDVTGVRCTIFRPPHGFRTPWLLKKLRQRGLACVEWSEAGDDWEKIAGAEITLRVVRRARPGAIVLLHDGLNVEHGADQSRTVDALPAIIRALKHSGYQFMTVPELLRRRNSRIHNKERDEISSAAKLIPGVRVYGRRAKSS
jgi:peptidoglycan/xylan/chitin deacetylase (PgdA/CDA1 family)